MRACILTTEGQPAAIGDAPEPVTPPDGAVVEVRASSVNGFDVFQASGAIMTMMPHDLPTIVGRDVAGVVTAVGLERHDVRVGDEVLGFITSLPPLHDGTWADQAVSDVKLILAHKPAALDWLEAGAIPLAGSTALDAVDAVAPRPGDAVLIMGATGGVGAFAIQLAAARGARVLASAKPGEDSDFVRSLGAAEVIDYTQPGLGDTVRRLTPDGLAGLIDAVSRAEAFGPLAALLRGGGRAATTLGAADVAALAARGVTATNVAGTPTTQKLSMLAEQAANGRLRVPIQASYELEDFGSAIDAFGSGTRGKIVLRMA